MGGPEEALDRVAARDWVWAALGGLSEVDRLVTVLRYFAPITSYERIATVCENLVGTVRSRLSHARRKLADGLRATADAAHPDADALSEARRREAADALAAALGGDFESVVRETWKPDAELVAPGLLVRGDRDFAVRAMNADLAAGVRQRLASVVAGRDVVIWETDLTSPGHCPPSAVWVHRLTGGRTRTMTLLHEK